MLSVTDNGALEIGFPEPAAWESPYAGSSRIGALVKAW